MINIQGKLSFLLILPAVAFASSGTGGNDDHQLSVSGGIASPSFSSAVFQNPAGLVYNSKFTGTIQAALQDPLTLRGGLLAGNGDFGAAAGLGHTFNQGSTSAFYGLAAQSQGLKIALGAAGFTDLSGGGTSFNAGLLIGPSEKYTFGFTAVGIDSGVKEFGAGFAARLDGISGFVLDATSSSSVNNIALQPGFIVGNSKAALTLSYGFNASSGTSRTSNGTFGKSSPLQLNSGVHSIELSDGFAAGGSLLLGSSTSWQIYYNQLAQWYTAVSFDL